MNQRQYHRELARLIDRLEGKRPSLLLHSCCGPCSSACLEYLTPHFDVTVFFYNPNIRPREEFDRRLEAQKQLLERAPFAQGVKLLVPDWEEEAFLAAAAGLEHLREGGARCTECFALRLEKTAEAARLGNFDYFTTTLTVSRHKNARLINELGEAIAARQGATWLPSDFKKGGGNDRSFVLAEEYGLYQQVWCGCGFPKEEQP